MKQKLFHTEQDGKCAFCGVDMKSGTQFDECTKRYSLPIIKVRQDKRSTFETCCKHHRARSEHDTCEAGVKYDDVRLMHEWIQYQSRGTIYVSRSSTPCFIDSNYKPDQCKCDKAEFPTKEEIQAHYDEMDALFEGIDKARKAIVNHLGGPWKKGVGSSQGVIECPMCKGKLHFSRSGYNGHIHAQCETKGCVSWME